MAMSHTGWALVGMIAYSVVALMVKLATRNGGFSSFAVLAIATSIVAVLAILIALARGDFQDVDVSMFLGQSAFWTYGAGICLAIAVSSLFRALSLGPASDVVPIYGMFVIGGSLLGIAFLGESLTVQKFFGMGFAMVSIYMMAR